MKFFVAFILLTISSAALSDYEVKHDDIKKETSPTQNANTHNGKYSRKGIETEEKQERQEQNENQDFDPELDAIDDDLTRDEGIFDE